MGLMADAVEAGKIKAVGVSNYSAAQMRTAYDALAQRGIPLASNQVEYSLLHRQPETNGVLDTCRELGITLIAYQPLASGALTGKYLDGSRPAGIRRFRESFRGAKVLRPVVTVLKLIVIVTENSRPGGAPLASRARRRGANSGREECRSGHS